MNSSYLYISCKTGVGEKEISGLFIKEIDSLNSIKLYEFFREIKEEAIYFVLYCFSSMYVLFLILSTFIGAQHAHNMISFIYVYVRNSRLQK